MHHSTEPNPVQHAGQRRTVGHITRPHIDARTQLLQLSDELTRTGSSRTAPGHQQQIPHPVHTHEVPG
ncbi:hypothetical protein EAO75_44405, partial [Streptomyces sp. uw30]